MHAEVCGFDLANRLPVMVGQDEEFRHEVLEFLEAPYFFPPQLAISGQTGQPGVARLTRCPGQIATQQNGPGG